MARTKSWTKVLIAILSLAMIAGLVALSLSLHAKAKTENFKARVFVDPTKTTADAFAKEKGFLAGSETSITDGAEGADGLVFYCNGIPALRTAIWSGSVKTAVENAGHTGADTDIEVYILSDMYYNSTANNYLFSDAILKIGNEPVTVHLIGAEGGDLDAVPTIWYKAGRAYIELWNNLIVDHVELRGASKANGSSANMNRILVRGATLKVENGGGIYDGNDSGNAAQLSNIACVGDNTTFDNARVQVATNHKNRTEFGQGGKLILNSGKYTTVQALNTGKYGIATTAPYTSTTMPTAEATNGAAMTGDYYRFASAADLQGKKNMTDSSRWFHYDYNSGKFDATVEVGGNAKVTTLRSTSDGDTITGKGVTVNLKVSGNAQVTNLYTHAGVGTKTFTNSTVQFSLVQFYSCNLDISGTPTIGKFRGGFISDYSFGTTVNPGSSFATGSSTYKYKSGSTPYYGEEELYGDLTVTITGGTIGDTFYAIPHAVGRDYSKNAARYYGNITYNLGEERKAGPSINNFFLADGSFFLGAPNGTSKLVVNVYSGTYNTFICAPNCAMLYTPEINLYGGNFNVVTGMGTKTGYTIATGGSTEITENLTGKNLKGKALLNITVDGANIGSFYPTRYYGGTSSNSDNLTRSVRATLKSGKIGSIHMFGDELWTGCCGRNEGSAPNDNELYWITLGDPAYEAGVKPLTIGEYYAGAAGSTHDHTYAGAAAVITQVYANVVINKDLTVDGVIPGGYTGEFYAIGNEGNTTEGENSGIYAVDVVLDLHGNNLSTRSNTNLFGNVVLEGSFGGSGSMNRAGGVYFFAESTSFATPGTHKTAGKLIDNNDGILLNGLTHKSSSGTETINDGGTSRTIDVFNGVVDIRLNNVTFGTQGENSLIHLLQTKQYKGSIKNTFTGCTFYGDYDALSNAQVGKPGSYTASPSAGTSTVAVTNNFTNCEFTGTVHCGAANAVTCANITTTLTNCTIGGSFFAGNVRRTSPVGDDGTAASRGGAYGIVATAIGDRGYFVTNMIGGSVGASFNGGNENALHQGDRAQVTITGTEDNHVTIGTYYTGAGGGTQFYHNASTTMNYVDIGSNYYGGITNSDNGTNFGSATYPRTIDNNLTNVTVGNTFTGGCYLKSTAIVYAAITNTLENVTIGNGVSTSHNFIGSSRRAKTMNGNVSNVLDNVTITGAFYGTTPSLSDATFTGNISNDLTDVILKTGSFIATYVKTTTGAITNTINGLEIQGQKYFYGVGYDVNFTGSVTNDLTDVTIPYDYIGAASGSSSVNGNVENTLEDVVCRQFFGSSSSATVTTEGNVTNYINGLKPSSYFYGGGNGPVNGCVTTDVTKFASASNKMERAFYAGGARAVTAASADADAIIFKVHPAKDDDVWFNGFVCAGTEQGAVTGKIKVDIFGGTQYGSRHLGLGNARGYTVSGGEITGSLLHTGDVEANIYGGYWGAVCLSARNYNHVATEYSQVGKVTLNYYGGSIGSVQQGFAVGTGTYVNGDVVVNIHTDMPSDPAIIPSDMVLRGYIMGSRAFSSEGRDNTPYTVNVIAGSRTLYYGTTTGAASASARVVAKDLTGTLKIAPATGTQNLMTVPEYAGYGAGGYFSDNDVATEGITTFGNTTTEMFQWEANSPVFTVLESTDREEDVIVTNASESKIIYTEADGKTTWTGKDMSITSPDARRLILGSQMSVRYLYDAEKIEYLGLTPNTTLTATYAINGGDAETATLELGTDDNEGYYFFIVPGIQIKDYNETTISVVTTIGETAGAAYNDSIAKQITDMNSSEDEALAKLATAIDNYVNAISAFFEQTEFPAVTATVEDSWVDAQTTGASTTKVAAGGVTVYGLSLNVDEQVTINFILLPDGEYDPTEATISVVDAASNTKAYTLVDREDGFWNVSCLCNANDLYGMFTLTINGEEFKACPLSYANILKTRKDLAPTYADLGQAIIEYAYQVSLLEE